ncbi:cation diffusion facilitator family transporter [Thermoanaerobacterium sp. DL9XJH110]|uniref:cation diffusion facilitator family transporter n=1 Tax=Thermoanaerobacterium sp. DL9XJH110 TaxID=3386643 RepID=UPI003BB5BA6F
MNRLVTRSVDFLISFFLKEKKMSDKITDETVRKKYAYLEAWVSIVGNLALAAVKIFFGIMLNSISLMADAVHTASDILTSVVVLLGFKFSSSPADEKHPYGHGRIEFIATLIIAIMLILVGVEFGKSSYQRLIINTPVRGSYPVALVMFFGAVFKEWMARFSIELGRRTGAPALIADAWHHRTDGIASVLVAIAIVATNYGYFKVDAVFGLGVSALIIYTGVSICRESASKLIGEVAEKDMINKITSLALSVPGVQGVHKINVHDYGAHKVISLHIQVESNLSLVEAHNISEQVERVIEANTNSRVIVHVEPEIDLIPAGP